MSEEHLVVDASTIVDLLLGGAASRLVRTRIDGVVLHAPAHLDSEVLSALGRLQRAGRLAAKLVAGQLAALADAPIARHALGDLVTGAWQRRHRLRLADALYVELADRLGLRLVTTDRALARATRLAEIVSG